MDVFMLGTGLAAVAFCVHVVLWRIRVPRREWSVLVLVFAAVAVLALSGALISPRFARFGMSTPRMILAGLVFGGLGIVYLILFSALESDSPTLTMIRLIRQHRGCGITEAELVTRSVERAYSRVRLEQMLRDGLAEQAGPRIRATPRGRRIALMVLWYCWLLGLRSVGGAITLSPDGQPR